LNHLVHTRILEWKLRKEIEDELEEEGAALEKTNSRPHLYPKTDHGEVLSRNKKAYIAFLDLQAVLDTIPWEQIWTALEKLGVT
jgi:predicted transcriptional regulator